MSQLEKLEELKIQKDNVNVIGKESKSTGSGMTGSPDTSCPYVNQNHFAKTILWWMNPIFKKGYKQKLQLEDLYEIANKHKSHRLTAKLEKRWHEEIRKTSKRNESPNFQRAFYRTYISHFLVTGIIAFLWEAMRCTGPILIGQLSQYFSYPDKVPFSYALFCAAGIALSTISSVWFGQIFCLRMQVLGWNARTAVVGLMYKKTLKLNNDALLRTSTGHIVNLSATDALRYDFAFFFMHHIWLAPLECIAATAILWLKIGHSGAVGMSVLLMILFVQACLGKLFGKLRLQAAIATDERVRTMSEIISGMRIIRLYSWEQSFREIVAHLRRKEMRKILHTSLLRAFNYTMTHSTSQILAFGTFMAYAAVYNQLTLEGVLVSLGLFNVLRVGVGVFFPMGIEKSSETTIALKRTQEFLLLPEVEQLPQTLGMSGRSVVRFTKYTGSWMQDGKPVLKNITLKVGKGQLLMVVGSIGSGKTSFLNAVLNELIVKSGDCEVRGKVAFSSQIPWLFADTIRKNIIFGTPYDRQRYNEVVKACALERDFEILPFGDQTLVGQRGVSLSGGQKARVSLARLAYRNETEIFLLDDPLSAVDPSVANHLFHSCICGYLKRKVRILVTHQLQFLEKADQIAILREGELYELGTYTELQTKGIDFTTLLSTKDDNSDVFSVKTVLSKASAPYSHSTLPSTEEKVLPDSLDVSNDGEDASSVVDPETVFLQVPTEDKAASDCKDGGIASDTYLPNKMWMRSYFDYFHTGVFFPFIIILILIMLANHALLLACDWWLAYWASSSERFNEYMNGTSYANVTRSPPINSTATLPVVVVYNQNMFVFWYSVLMLGFLSSMLVRTISHFYLCFRSSVALHDKMLDSVLRAKIRFFDTVPVGNILNRFSKDLGQVDELLPLVFMDVLFLFGSVMAIIIFVATINYFVLMVVCPMLVYFVWIRAYFVRTSKEIKRIEGAYRSPVFGHLSSTLQGLVVIRAYGVQDQFIAQYNRLQDQHSVAWSAFVFGSRWFAFRLDTLSAVFISACAFLSLLIASNFFGDGPIAASNLGLTLTYSITLLSIFQWSVRQSAEVDNLMTSAERIRLYHNLPTEPYPANPIKPSTGWPDNGAITFNDVSFAHFSGGPFVLKHLNLDIQPQEKIGIVGRTGAGKSSLIAALFRLSDQITGSITIDGIDTANIPLRDLRSAMSIIPQDPVLFGATIRKNLDTYSSYTDEELWDTLEQVQLKALVEGLPKKLESELAEEGTNFSVGQRQLICLARAILRQSRILVIDEATANVDRSTDQLIQKTISEKFAECTVLTIAHRLNTIIDSDRIAVLDNGCLIECDEPHELLQNNESVFSEMVRMTGEHEQELRSDAEKGHNRRLKVRSNLSF